MVTILIVIVAIGVLKSFIFPGALDSYRPSKISRERADDIARAIFEYKGKTGQVPDFSKPGWAFELKDYLSNVSNAYVTPQGQIKDAKGSPYELSSHGDVIDIYSYSMIVPKRVDLNTGTITDGVLTKSQSVRVELRGFLGL